MDKDPLLQDLPESTAPQTEADNTAGQVQNVSLVRSAGINSIGNVLSRIIGMLRESLITYRFGASGYTSAYVAVSRVPKMVYELLIGGMLSAALVPVLSEYAGDDRKEEMDEILSTVLTLAGIVLFIVVVLLELSSRLVASLLLEFDTELLNVAVTLTRIIVPSIFIYGISGILQAFHYARQKFVYPSLGAPAHNLGMVLSIVLFAGQFGINTLAVGTVLAALSQLVVQLPGLKGFHYRFSLNWRHPAILRILHLYGPVIVSTLVSNIGTIIDANLASRTGEEAITWMANATFLTQLCVGLVSMAISLAVLPRLSQIDFAVELDRFKRTLASGLRLVLALIIPAGVGLLVLGKPIIELLFEHGAFEPSDTQQAWMALLCYLPGLPFSAIDLPLVFSFYSQKDTVTPVIVGIITVVLYVIVAPLLAFVADIGFLGLVLANSLQLIAHAVLMLILFNRRFGTLKGYGVMSTAFRSLGASVLVGASAWAGVIIIDRLMPTTSTLREIILVAIPMGLGTLAYMVGARLFRIRDINNLMDMLRARFSR